MEARGCWPQSVVLVALEGCYRCVDAMFQLKPWFTSDCSELNWSSLNQLAQLCSTYLSGLGQNRPWKACRLRAYDISYKINNAIVLTIKAIRKICWQIQASVLLLSACSIGRDSERDFHCIHSLVNKIDGPKGHLQRCLIANLDNFHVNQIPMFLNIAFSCLRLNCQWTGFHRCLIYINSELIAGNLSRLVHL